MTSLENFIPILNDFDANFKAWEANDKGYRLKINHLLLAPIISEADRFIRIGIVACKQLVELTKTQEAYGNNGLPSGKRPLSEIFHAAILKNQPVFQRAFDAQRTLNPEKLETLLWTVKNAKLQLDQIIGYAEALANAQWHEGAELPTDNKPKWVTLRHGIYYSYLEKEAYYDLLNKTWVFKGEPADDTFEVYNWMEIPEAKLEINKA